MDEDEEGETWSWNLVAPGMDINMKGPTVSTHNGKEWVHINDYRRVKRTLNSYVKEKEWDGETIKELNAQVSNLRGRHKYSAVKRGRNSLNDRRQNFSPEDHLNENNIMAKVKEIFPNVSYPPEGWHRYSENENTVCGQVMGSVSLSHGQDMQDYWHEFAAAVANRTWIDLRSIKDKHVSKVVKGEPTVALRRK